MSRNFVRPEVKANLDLFAPSRVVLINPTLDELRAALKKLQKGCRKNTLSAARLEHLFPRCVDDDSFDSAVIGEFDVPWSFLYPVSGTQVQVVRLASGLLGWTVERANANPGESSTLPVSAPAKTWERRNQIIATYWGWLTDEEIESFSRGIVVRTMLRAAARQRNTQGVLRALIEEAEAKTTDDLSALYDVTVPVYTPVLLDALDDVCKALVSEGKDRIAWGDFKKRWPSLAATEESALRPLLRGSVLERSDLESVQASSDFSIGFALWEGPQRIFPDDAQIVIAVNAPALLRQLSSLSLQADSLATTIRELGSMSSHPTSSATIGWLRIHWDLIERLVFVDEVQSDVMELLYSMREEKTAKGPELDTIRRFESAFRRWHFHGMATARAWAKQIGFRLGLHTEASFATKPGATRSARKWNTYYQPLAKRFAMKEEAVPGYPAPVFVCE